MKKNIKKVIVLSLLISLTMSLISCKEVSDADLDKWLDKYDVVLSQYKNIISNQLDIMSLGDEFKYTNLNLFRDGNNSKYYQQPYNVYYALCDLNKNDIPEMIIGGGFEDNIRWYSFFTYDNGVVMSLESQTGSMLFGEKAQFTIYEDGTIEISNGYATCYDSGFYKLSKDEKIELTERVWYEFDQNNNREIFKYYSGSDIFNAAENSLEILKEEYDDILNKYESLNIIKPNFKVLSIINDATDNQEDSEAKMIALSELPEFVQNYSLYKKENVILDWDASNGFGGILEAVQSSDVTVELYTNASFSEESGWDWDDGNNWALLVRKSNKCYLLMDETTVNGGLPAFQCFYNYDSGKLCVLLSRDTLHGITLKEYWYDKIANAFNAGKDVYDSGLIFQILN